MRFPKTILHVDDDYSILRFVNKFLTSQGYKVVSTAHPTEALSKLAECRAQIVILDIDMPEKDGMTLLREIKQLNAGTLVIMCTGMVSINTLLRATFLGAETCVFKPINDIDRLRNAVDRASERIDQRWFDMQEWVERNKSEVRFDSASPSAKISKILSPEAELPRQKSKLLA